MNKIITDCCALCQLSGLNNSTPRKQIEAALVKLTKEKNENVEVGVNNTGKGQTTVFVIVTPSEAFLEANLISLGFSNVHAFERRKGYPQTGLLKMFIKNL